MFFIFFMCFTSLLYSILVSPICVLLLRLKEYLFFERVFRWIFLFFLFHRAFLLLLLFHSRFFGVSCESSKLITSLFFDKNTCAVFCTLCILPFFLSSFFHDFFAFIFSKLLFIVFHSPFSFLSGKPFSFPIFFSLLSNLLSFLLFLHFFFISFFPSFFFRLFFPSYLFFYFFPWFLHFLFPCFFLFFLLLLYVSVSFFPLSLVFFYLLFTFIFIFSSLSFVLFVHLLFCPSLNSWFHFSLSDRFFISVFLDLFCSWSHFSWLPSSQHVPFISISSKIFFFLGPFRKLPLSFFHFWFIFLCEPFFESNLLFFLPLFLLFFPPFIFFFFIIYHYSLISFCWVFSFSSLFPLFFL